jgi:hypothetical protein
VGGIGWKNCLFRRLGGDKGAAVARWVGGIFYSPFPTVALRVLDDTAVCEGWGGGVGGGVTCGKREKQGT